MVPWLWIEKLKGKPWYVYHVALLLLYLHWQHGDRPIKLASGMLVLDGVSRNSKRRALIELENLGLITAERRSRKSPIVTIAL
jgi:DNA-binding transcriptional ArsR family regulator